MKVKLVRRLVAVLAFVLGAAFVYFAGFLFWTEVVPQVRAGGWSLTRNNMILNRHWPGNQLYVLIGLYLLLAAGLGRGALVLWRNPPRLR